jgi:hypothetical protein
MKLTQYIEFGNHGYQSIGVGGPVWFQDISDISSFDVARHRRQLLKEVFLWTSGATWWRPISKRADRRRPYRLTAQGATVLANYIKAQQRILKTGQARLKRSWSLA